jgi:polyphosphate kinase
VCWFENDSNPQLFCASADRMNRNLFQRVETCFPVLNAELHARVLEEGLDCQLLDNVQAWVMQADGSYVKVQALADSKPLSAQDASLQLLAGMQTAASTSTRAIPKRFC